MGTDIFITTEYFLMPNISIYPDIYWAPTIGQALCWVMETRHSVLQAE